MTESSIMSPDEKSILQENNNLSSNLDKMLCPTKDQSPFIPKALNISVHDDLQNS